MFHIFLVLKKGRDIYLSFHFFFLFFSVDKKKSGGTFLLLTITRFGPLIEIRGSFCILYYFYTLRVFFSSALADGLSLESAWQQVSSMTLLGILGDLTYAAVWIVFTRHLISKSSSPCTNLLMTEPRASITIGTTITFMSHSFFFFNSLSRGTNCSFQCFFNFTLWSARIAKSTILQVLFYYLPLEIFFSSALADSLSLDFERQQVFAISRTLLSVLVDLNNVVD